MGRGDTKGEAVALGLGCLIFVFLITICAMYIFIWFLVTFLANIN